MRNRDFLADWPGRRDKTLKPGLSHLKRDVWYAYVKAIKILWTDTAQAKRLTWSV